MVRRGRGHMHPPAFPPNGDAQDWSVHNRPRETQRSPSWTCDRSTSGNRRHFNRESDARKAATDYGQASARTVWADHSFVRFERIVRNQPPGKAVIYQWESRKRTPLPVLWQRLLALTHRHPARKVNATTFIRSEVGRYYDPNRPQNVRLTGRFRRGEQPALPNSPHMRLGFFVAVSGRVVASWE